MVQGNQEEGRGLKGKGEDSVGTCCKETDHWRKNCQNNTNKKDRNPAEKCYKGVMNLEAQGLPRHLPTYY